MILRPLEKKRMNGTQFNLSIEDSEIHILEWNAQTKLFGSVFGTLLLFFALCGFVSSVISYKYITYRQSYKIK